MRRAGYAALAFDILQGDVYDLERRVTQNLVFGWLSSSCIAGIWIGIPCGSWSRARRGPPGSNWCAIRSRRHINGIPDLPPRDCAKLAAGNRMLKLCIRIIKAARAAGIPVALENPGSSLLWHHPTFRQLLGHASVHDFDYCQYGKPWRKRTKVVSWGVRSSRTSCNMFGIFGYLLSLSVALDATC